MENLNNGKFIIIEGADGTGKTTQLKKIADYCIKLKKEVKILDFPQYENFWGKMIGRFLRGEFGELDNVNPYLISPIYALDQGEASSKIKTWLDKGYIVLSNRYLTSSMAHQTAKFEGETEKERYLSWLMEMGYNQLGLIKEHITIVLDVETKISIKNAKKAYERKSFYMKDKDIAEESKYHQKKSRNMYQELSNRFDWWHRIECMGKNGNLLTIEEVHKKVLKTLYSNNIL